MYCSMLMFRFLFWGFYVISEEINRHQTDKQKALHMSPLCMPMCLCFFFKREDRCLDANTVKNGKST